MAYLVSIAARAERDLAHLYEEIDAASSGAALKWYKGLRDAILSLEEAPNRCPATPEKRHLWRRRIYVRDLLAFKAKRDSKRRQVPNDLTRAEAEDGLHDLEPPDDRAE